jgi:hypothetical protein
VPYLFRLGVAVNQLPHITDFQSTLELERDSPDGSVSPGNLAAGDCGFIHTGESLGPIFRQRLMVAT